MTDSPMFLDRGGIAGIVEVPPQLLEVLQLERSEKHDE